MIMAQDRIDEKKNEGSKSPDKNAGFVARTAVLVVHGMGNQRPLNTMREIVDALYTSDPALEVVNESFPPHSRPYWSWLSRANTNVDLPVITTAAIKTGPNGNVEHRRIDFHEFYWADIMSENRFVAVPLWLFELVRKGASRMLPGLRPLWLIVGVLLAWWLMSAVYLVEWGVMHFLGLIAPTDLWAGVAISWIPALFLCGALMGWRGAVLLAGPFLVFLLIHIDEKSDLFPMALIDGSHYAACSVYSLLLFLILNAAFLLTVVGDAARYYRASPDNIAVRRAIRARGVDILEGLHSATVRDANKKEQYRYDRIIVVAHSLGSPISYDMLRGYWSAVATSLGDPFKSPFDANSRDRQNSPADWDKWRKEGRELVGKFAHQPVPAGAGRQSGKIYPRWAVTDFVTLGSPLAQAAFLMAEGTGDATLKQSLARKFEEREFPRCPSDPNQSSGILSSKSPGGDNKFDRGALFALTRWTNLYFPCKYVLWGDMVGGPVGFSEAGENLFGPGVKDVPVSGAPRQNLMSHTHYWTTPNTKGVGCSRPAKPPCYLRALREAVNLRDI